MARVTLWGMYQYDKTLFDNIVLPDGIDKDNLVSDIMRNSGDLYPYYQVPEYLKRNITFWFARRLFDFSRMYESLRVEYSPIENYDRMEDIKREYKDSGTDTETLTLGSSTTSTRTGTDTDTMQGGGSTEKGVSAYNETGYTNREKDTETQNSTNTKQYDSTVTNTGSGTDTQKQTFDSTVTNTGSGSDTTKTDYGKQRTETENTRIHGNIGVPTSQQMIESEMSLRAKYDISKIISREFEREFLVQIY